MGRILEPAFGGTEMDDLYEQYVTMLVSAVFLKGYAMGAEGAEVDAESFTSAIDEAAEKAMMAFAEDMVEAGRFSRGGDAE